MGKNMINAKAFLEKRYNEELELEDAVHTAILTLKVAMGEERSREVERGQERGRERERELGRV